MRRVTALLAVLLLVMSCIIILQGLTIVEGKDNKKDKKDDKKKDDKKKDDNKKDDKKKDKKDDKKKDKKDDKKKKEKNRVIAAFPSTTLQSSPYKKIPDVMYKTGTIAEARNTSVMVCQQRCDDSPSCKGFTYSNDASNMCTWKSVFETPTPYLGVDTYLKPPRK